MTTINRGKYASKHPEGTELESAIANKIQIKQENGRLTCATAVKIAAECDVPLELVGRNADLMEIRIDHCILGLFGFELEDGEKRKIKPAQSVSSEVEEAIQNRLVKGRLPCKAAWDIADHLGVSRKTIAETCEALKIRISSCQLGAF